MASGSVERVGLAERRALLGCVLLGSALLSFVSLGCDPQRDPEPARRGAPAGASPGAQAAPYGQSAPSPVAPKVERHADAMGTRVYLAAYAPPGMDEAATAAVLDAAIDQMRRLEAELSEWRGDSDVGRINAHPGQWVPVGTAVQDVIERSLWAGRLSDGAFDITFQVLRGLWNFGSDSDPTPRVPAAAEIARRRARIDFRKIDLDREGQRVRIGPEQAIGLGGIAKGYIVDRSAEALRRAGLSSFLIQAGGDLYGAGRKPDGSPWVSGIRDPRGPAESFFAVLELSDHAFSTAGDYARAYVSGGRRYHHIIDPKTGYPATHSRSVTVWAPDALTADALDDAIFILGPERGLALARTLPEIGVIIVDADNRIHMTPNLSGQLRMTRPPSDGI